MQETWVQFLAQEDPLEEMATTPVFLPGKSHGQRIPGGLRGVTGSDTTEHTCTNADQAGASEPASTLGPAQGTSGPHSSSLSDAISETACQANLSGPLCPVACWALQS